MYFENLAAGKNLPAAPLDLSKDQFRSSGQNSMAGHGRNGPDHGNLITPWPACPQP